MVASMSKRTMPSMSLGVRPASSMALRDASTAVLSSGRPRPFEYSVWPMPVIAVLFLRLTPRPAFGRARNARGSGDGEGAADYSAFHPGPPARMAP